MGKFIRQYAHEILLILIAMLGISRWWMPRPVGFDNLYSAGEWVLSYDHGFLRRGLVGTIVSFWVPVVTVETVFRISLVAYCILLFGLLVVFYLFMKRYEQEKRFFRLFLFLLVNPATLSFLARDLGRFDLFLIMIMMACYTFLALRRFLWLIPVLCVIAMLIHEAFLVLFAPTLVAGILFVYVVKGKEKKIMALLVSTVVALLGAYVVLNRFGTPSLGFDEFSKVLQARADFYISDLVRKECYYTLKDHLNLAFSYVYEPASIANLFLSLIIVSPALLVFRELWGKARSRHNRTATGLFFLATLCAFLLLPIAFDYGRWISAFVFSNCLAIVFLFGTGALTVEDLERFSEESFTAYYVTIIVVYLLFGYLRVVYPFPYRDYFFYTFLSVISVLFFDIGFFLHRRWSGQRGTGA